MALSLFHLAKDQIAPAQRFFRIEQRRISNRSFRQAGEQGGFRQVQLAGVFGEVKLARRLKAIHAVAEVNLVAVEGEDLFLGKRALNLDGQVRFLHLARRGALGGEEEVARQLHGQRGSALRASMGDDVVPQRSGHAEDVDAPVRFEVLVFNGDNRLAQDRREIIVVDDDAPLQCKGAEGTAFLVVELGRSRGPVALKIMNLRQIYRIDQRQPGQRAGNCRQAKKHSQSEPAGELAPVPLRRRFTLQRVADGSRLAPESERGLGGRWKPKSKCLSPSLPCSVVCRRPHLLRTNPEMQAKGGRISPPPTLVHIRFCYPWYVSYAAFSFKSANALSRGASVLGVVPFSSSSASCSGVGPTSTFGVTASSRNFFPPGLE